MAINPNKLIGQSAILCTSLWLTGCELTPLQTNTLEEAFYDDPALIDRIDASDIEFYSGPKDDPKNGLSYVISEDIALIAYPNNNIITSYNFPLAGCQHYAESLINVQIAYSSSAKLMSDGPTQINSANVGVDYHQVPLVVMDGPSYLLVIHDSQTWSKYSIKGSQNSQIRAPWVDAAIDLGNVLLACGIDYEKNKPPVEILEIEPDYIY